MGTLWLVLATVATITIAIIVFHEKLNTLQWVGVFLALIALALLSTWDTDIK